MPKVQLNDLASLANETSSIATINANNFEIEEGFNNTLSRDGTSPNTMGAQIDMNTNRIVNIPTVPTSNNEAASKYYVDYLAGLLSDNTPTNPSDAIIEGNLDVGGSLTVAQDIDITGSVTIDTDLTVGGDLEVNGTITQNTVPVIVDTDIGVTVQAWDADLDTISAISKTDGNFIVANGTTWVAESGDTARTSLGVGTADSPQFTAVNVGNATDTTLSRASAGDLNVEGNLIYRAGGTDVPVADGGSGRSSATAYAVICGGTTSTAAHQSIASVGSSGQVLTSNGASALPTFQTPGAGVISIITSGSFSSTTDLVVEVDSGFDIYEVDLINVTPSTDNTTLQLTVSDDNASTYETGASDYEYAVVGNSTTALSAASSSIILTAGVGNLSDESFSLKMTMYYPNVSASKRVFIGFGSQNLINGNHISLTSSGNFVGNTNALTDVKFQMSSGTFSSGLYIVKGYTL